jgi:hypothetical protein
MSDLIWVGNTLLPRGVVFAAAIIVILLVAAGITALVSALSRHSGEL